MGWKLLYDDRRCLFIFELEITQIEMQKREIISVFCSSIIPSSLMWTVESSNTLFVTKRPVEFRDNVMNNSCTGLHDVVPTVCAIGELNLFFASLLIKHGLFLFAYIHKLLEKTLNMFQINSNCMWHLTSHFSFFYIIIDFFILFIRPPMMI